MIPDLVAELSSKCGVRRLLMKVLAEGVSAGQRLSAQGHPDRG